MFQTIECSQIDFDNTEYLMSYPVTSKKITASVGTVGVLQPIILSGCPCKGGYQILAGFRRAEACRRLRITSVNAYLYQVPEESKITAFWMVLQENVSHRTFNDVEKSLILTKLLNQFQCSRHEIINTYLPLIGLAPHGKILDTYLKIGTFDDEIKDHLVAHGLPMNILEMLGNLSVEDRNAVFALMSHVKFSVSKLKELLTHLDDIALRDHRSIAQILADAQIQEALTNDALPGPQKAEQIRQFVHGQRFPHFSQLEQEYQRRLKQLHLSPPLRVQTDRFFEADEMSVSFRFKNPAQLRNVADELLALSQNEHLPELLQLIRGEQK